MTAFERLKTGVVGSGYFGMIHARKYVSFPESAWVGVYDVDTASARAAVAELGGKVFASPKDLFSSVDAVSITSPGTTHYALAREALNAGCHVLVEKPLALNVAEADELVALANAKNLVLQVGHQERFVFAHYGLLRDRQKPLRIACRRAGPFTGRGMDVSVIMDLMIHDLDLVQCMTTPDITDIRAQGRSVHSALYDEVTAELEFADGMSAYLFASRIAEERERRVTMTYPDGVIEIDFVRRTFRNTTRHRVAPVFGPVDNAPGADVLSDPVGYSIGAFLECARTGRPAAITGGQARKAVNAACQITAVLEGRTPALSEGLRAVTN